MTDGLREHQATSNNLITAINNLTTAISTHMDTPYALNHRLHDEGGSSKAILGAIDTCVAGHVQEINSCATANHAHLATQALRIQEQASDILHVMEDIKSTSEETVRTLSAIPMNLPSCSEYTQGSGTTSIDSNMLPKDDEHMDRNKAAILCRQQEEFLKGSEEALNAEEVDLD
ncbi:hypothetical protein BG003_000497 [Podila horticola]|nr:hypothetical protein BG003_000497 [Podila horticola]